MNENYIVHDAGAVLVNWMRASLVEALRQALQECKGENEEEGGFLVKKDDDTVQFFKITNAHSGTLTARGLFEPDRAEYGEKVIASYGQGFKNFASFHTHPTNYPAYPSGTDVTRLFNGQPINFIWSPSLKDLRVYTYLGRKETSPTTVDIEWMMQTIDSDKLLTV